MADLKLWVQVLERDGTPIAGADVTAAFVPAVSDAEGNAKSDTVSLTVRLNGYVPYVEQPYLAPSADAPIVIHLEGKPGPPQPGPGPALQELTVRGHCFQLADGTPWSGRGSSDFNLLNLYQHGVDITPVLAQRAACGFNLLRVWTAFDIPGIGTFLDIDYSRIPAFVALCANYGLWIEFCGYTGWNDTTHWPQLCDAARKSTPRPLVELVNELSENTNEPDALGRVFNLADYAKPAGLLSSHGSNGSEKWPVEPYWDYGTFHTNMAFEEQRKVGHGAWEIWNGPVLTNETSRFEDVGMWRGRDLKVQQQLAADSAKGAALLCAGSWFHSRSGKTSVLFGQEELAVAAAWCAGALSVNLDYQDGRYIHRQDLETPDLLRVYERRYDDARGGEIVKIRRAPVTREDILRAREVFETLAVQWLATHPRDERLTA